MDQYTFTILVLDKKLKYYFKNGYEKERTTKSILYKYAFKYRYLKTGSTSIRQAGSIG
jgi:hypothetical protein